MSKSERKPPVESAGGGFEQAEARPAARDVVTTASGIPGSLMRLLRLFAEEKAKETNSLVINVFGQDSNPRFDVRIMAAKQEYTDKSSGPTGAKTFGPNSKSESHGEVGRGADSLDYASLRVELAELLREMLKQAETPDEKVAAAEIAAAELAAEEEDRSEVLKRLKAAGSWATDVATTIGASLCSELLKKQFIS